MRNDEIIGDIVRDKRSVTCAKFVQNPYFLLIHHVLTEAKKKQNKKNTRINFYF